MRDSSKATIPIGLLAFFWINVAAWVHLGAGVAGYEVALKHDDEKALTTFAESIGSKIDRKQAPMEIDVATDGTTAPPVDTAAPPPPPKPTATQDPKKDPPKPPDPKKDDPKKIDEPKKDEPKVAIAKPTATQTAAPPPPPQPKDQRIAVKQHVKTNQDDNPNAHFIADEANHTDEESVATITSHDQDNADPKPAGDHQNASKDPGDSDNQRIADSDEHKGEPNKAPGEKGTEFDVLHNEPQDKPMAATAVQGPANPAPVQSGGDGKVAGGAQTPAPPELAPGNAAPPSPNVVDSQNGGWTFSIARAPGTGNGQDTGPGSTSRTLQPPPLTTSRPYGLGGNPGPGQVNINLDNKGVIAVIGRDQLRKDREGDGERRLAEHRGSWTSSSFDKWRPAIENYVSSVKPGNQTALNTAAVPFASYLNAMHNRIHPIFADSFLASLDSLPATNPLNDPKLVTRLEIVLTRDGHITKMGIVKTSGVTAFDIAALDSVQRASPFGPAPNAIVSTDGAVYLHWEFHRDEVYACSTMNARPFMLNNPAGAPPVDPNPKTPGGPQEKGPPPTGDVREGLFLLPAPKAPRAG
jgi:TonB family protein